MQLDSSVEKGATKKRKYLGVTPFLPHSTDIFVCYGCLVKLADTLALGASALRASEFKCRAVTSIKLYHAHLQYGK